MSAALSSTPQPGREPPQGGLAWLASLARALVFPFDKVLAGMARAGICIEGLCLLLGLTRAALDEHVVRLGLATPNDKPFRRPSTRGWSIADQQRLLAWRPAGVHPEVIGQSLEKPRSANAVRAKARRLGLEAPPRASLFRPDPATLTRQPPDFGFTDAAATPEASCGRAAGPATCRVVETAEPVPPTKAPVAAGRRNDRREGQRELPLFGIVGGSDHAQTPASPRQTPAPVPVPRTREEVDWRNLTWIGALPHPLTSDVAVFAVGMLFMSGLHWRAVAKLIGRSPDSLKTLRTRMGIPVDPDRKKICAVFDEEVARATMERSDLVVRQSLKTECQKWGPEFFWIERSDRRTRLSPLRRKRDRMIEGRSPEMEIVTRAQLDAEARARSRPFADSGARISA